MTHDQHSPAQGSTLDRWIGTLAMVWGTVAILWMIALPFFWPSATQWEFWRSSLRVVAWSLLPTPLLFVYGFGRYQQMQPRQLLRLLLRIVGLLLLLASLAWAIHNGLSLRQAARTNSHPLLRILGLYLLPTLLALSITMLRADKVRDIIGTLLCSYAYTCLLLLLLLGAMLMAPPSSNPALAPAALKKAAVLHGILAAICAVVGTILLSKKLRLRLHLLFTFPLWLPPFMLFFFWSLLLNTTIYFLEDLLKTKLEWPTPLKWFLLGIPSLVLFPLLLSIDFTAGLIRQLGTQVLQRLYPSPEAGAPAPSFSTLQVMFVGALLLFTLPLWLLPAFVYWSIRLFIYESILQHLFGRPAFTEHQKSSQP